MQKHPSRTGHKRIPFGSYLRIQAIARILPALPCMADMRPRLVLQLALQRNLSPQRFGPERVPKRTLSGRPPHFLHLAESGPFGCAISQRNSRVSSTGRCSTPTYGHSAGTLLTAASAILRPEPTVHSLLRRRRMEDGVGFAITTVLPTYGLPLST